jgi:hypothetical protein
MGGTATTWHFLQGNIMSRNTQSMANANWEIAQKVTYMVEAFAAVVLIALLCFGSDAKAQSGNVYGYGQAQQMSQSVESGVVLQVAQKRVEASFQNSATGTAIGGVLGGVVGSQIDKGFRFGGVALGTTLGGLIGNRVAANSAATQAQEVIIGIKAKDGNIAKVVTVVQPAPFDAVASGQNVLVVNINGVYRVLPQQYLAAAVTTAP